MKFSDGIREKYQRSCFDDVDQVKMFMSRALRRGIGTTLTLYAVMDSINEGNDLHTLQTEKGGYAEELYRKTGFEIDHTISYFVKKFGGSNCLKRSNIGLLARADESS